jgi:hypothetical protein
VPSGAVEQQNGVGGRRSLRHSKVIMSRSVWNASAGHEYFPNLPQPKGFNDNLLRIAVTKVFRMMGDSPSRMHLRNTHTDLATFREDPGALKRGVANLIEHVRRRPTEFRTPPAKLIKERHFFRRAVKNRLLCTGAPR